MPTGVYERTEWHREISRQNGRKSKTGGRPGGSFLGKKHTAETREKIRQARAKQVITEEHKANQAESLARYIAENGPNTGRRIGSWPEVVMAAILLHAGVEFEAQRRFGRYVVDFYLPASRAVVEVDGAYWHQDQKKQERRDAYLIDHGVSFVNHITDQQLNVAGWL